jgi:single-strand DNA-binding protein
VSITTWSLAVNESWTDKQTGEKQERVEWMDCKAFGKTAELAGKYITKGANVYALGTLRTETWNDKQTGEKRSAKKMIVEKFQVLSRLGDAPRRERPEVKAPEVESDEFNDDIPF